MYVVSTLNLRFNRSIVYDGLHGIYLYLDTINMGCFVVLFRVKGFTFHTFDPTFSHKVN